MTQSLQTLFETLPQTGHVVWLGLRPERKAPMQIIGSVQAKSGQGLSGDRYSGKTGNRAITLIQQEHQGLIFVRKSRNLFQR